MATPIYQTKQNPEESGNSSLAAAFQKSGIEKLRERLPEKADIITIEVNMHPVSKQACLKPQYLEKDPFLEGVPSMRMFHPVKSKGKRLFVGQAWKARIDDMAAGGLNKKDIRIVHVNIVLLETVNSK